MQKNYLFTSESVSEGHPDKICDQISDNILDFCLSKNPNSRVACEVFVTGNKIIVGGEITPKPNNSDIIRIIKTTLDNIGYRNEYGISSTNLEIEILIQNQSSNINQGVDRRNNIICAGDQGIMFGYATDECKTNYMPLPLTIAHDLVKYASQLRKKNNFLWARPDMKSQVTIEYLNNRPHCIDTILMSIQHDPGYNSEKFKSFIKTKIMNKIAKKYNLNTNFKFLINPTGKFVIGGPIADTGLTGRKIIVDTYGGAARHGGGAFSGKDYTKVDRTASYMCRYVAKNIVASGIAKKCEIEVSYAIGQAKPTSLWIDTKNTSAFSNYEIIEMINHIFDFSINGMINTLNLRKPIYSQTSVYGHFGRNEFEWEKLDEVENIKLYFRNNPRYDDSNIEYSIDEN